MEINQGVSPIGGEGRKNRIVLKDKTKPTPWARLIWKPKNHTFVTGMASREIRYLRSTKYVELAIVRTPTLLQKS